MKQGVVLVLFNDSDFTRHDEKAVVSEVPHLGLPFERVIFLCPQRPGLLDSATVSADLEFEEIVEASHYVVVVYNFAVKPFILLDWVSCFGALKKPFRILYKLNAAPGAPSGPPACGQAALDPLPF